MIEDWLADERAERRRAATRAAARREARAKASALDDAEKKTDGTDGDGVPASLEETLNDAGTNDDAFETKHARGEKGLPSRYSKPSSDVPDTNGDASVASTSSRLRRPGLPSRAGAVSQETRDQLRAARAHVRRAPSRRAASGVSAEEQRWLDVGSARFASGESGESGVGTSARPRSFFASNEGDSRGDDDGLRRDCRAAGTRDERRRRDERGRARFRSVRNVFGGANAFRGARFGTKRFGTKRARRGGRLGGFHARHDTRGGGPVPVTRGENGAAFVLGGDLLM